MTLHILPINDLKEHKESDDCECKPRVEFVGEGEKIVIHNSYDGREFWEEWEAGKQEKQQ